ncbi:YcaO-like family protein [Nocardioides litoris]|uniref:YcaO-like family protein n=1 Tax=Nocardioides litoris TaxID=1926648 RepID=UPI0011217242|nr:YcaO-like family protein [Nocardioides litoris]
MTVATLPVDHLVDPELGVVLGLHPVDRVPGLPASYVGLTAEVADSRVHGNWPSDRVSLGTTFGDLPGARIAAIGEAVERYCGNHVPGGLRRATARELAAEGRRVLGPDDLRFFADWQHDQPGFPFARFTDDVEIAWTEGRSAPHGEAVLVPASWAHLNWRTGARRTDPWLHHVNYAGIATGQGLADAARRGLLELVERDALSLWWHLGLDAPGLDAGSVPGLLDDLLDDEGRARLEVHLLALPSWYAVPVVAAVVHDRRTGIVAGGFSAKLDPAETARKAVLEAVHSWVFTQGLLEPDGWVFGAIAEGVLSEGLYLPHRPDRDYLAVAGPRQERVRDLGAQAQVWLDPEVQRRLLPRFTAPATTVALDALPVGTEAGLHAALAAAGHEVVVCDLTTPDVALTPLRVARVCATGLVPNAPAAFPYYGLPRWTEVGGRPPTPESLLLLPPPSL